MLFLQAAGVLARQRDIPECSDFQGRRNISKTGSFLYPYFLMCLVKEEGKNFVSTVKLGGLTCWAVDLGIGWDQFKWDRLSWAIPCCAVFNSSSSCLPNLAEKYPLKFVFEQLTEFQLMGGGLDIRKRFLFCSVALSDLQQLVCKSILLHRGIYQGLLLRDCIHP